MAKLKINELPKGVVTNKEEQIREKTSDFKNAYANSISVSLSPWDMRITFGQNDSRNGKALVREEVEITMSKEIAKVLIALMQSHFDLYEKQFGEIIIPDLLSIKAEHDLLQPKKKEMG